MGQPANAGSQQSFGEMENEMNTIKNFSGEYDFLSNAYPCDIVYNGYSYCNVETAFQEEKKLYTRDSSKHTSPSGHSYYLFAYKGEQPKDWEEHQLDVMWDLLCIKFLTHPELLAKLLKTGDALISEEGICHDNFWGVCQCVCCSHRPSANMLGVFLMHLRDTMLAGQKLDNIPKTFQYMGIEVAPIKLFSRVRILALLHFQYNHGKTLNLIREQYTNIFGIDIVWRYPIFDIVGEGGVLIPVREGFLWLPYDSDMVQPTENFRTQEAHLLDQKEIGTLLRELNTYTDDLKTTMADALSASGNTVKFDDEPYMTLPLPHGQTLRAVLSHDTKYPGIRIELEGAGVQPVPLCHVEHNPMRPTGHQICVCAYSAASDDPDYYKSYSPCEDNNEKE